MSRTLRWGLRAGLAFAAAASTLAAPAAAQTVEAGDLDRSFGTAGYFASDAAVDTQLLDFDISAGGAIALLLRLEGNRVVAARLTEGGRPDPAFGSSGQYPAFQPSDQFQDDFHATIRPDGDVIVAGFLFGGRCDNVVQLGQGGRVEWNDGYTDCQAQDIGALTSGPDSSVYVAGWVGATADKRLGVWRHLPDGSRDSAFGAAPGGIVELGPGVASDVDLQPGGGILLTGERDGGDMVVARVTATGGLDASFGTAGFVDVAGASSCGTEVGPDGSIYLCVQTDSGSELRRLSADGAVDATFGTGGRIGGGSDSWIADFAVQPDGRLLVYVVSDSDVLLNRHRADGSLDGPLLTGASLQVGPAGWHATLPERFAVQPSGRILGLATSQFRWLPYQTNVFPNGVFVAGFHGKRIVPPPPPPPPPAPPSSPAPPSAAPKPTRACTKARAARAKALRAVRTTQRRLERAQRRAVKRKLRTRLAKRKVALRQATRKRARACR